VRPKRLGSYRYKVLNHRETIPVRVGGGGDYESRAIQKTNGQCTEPRAGIFSFYDLVSYEFPIFGLPLNRFAIPFQASD
jgi:hypothetical protein